jgi:hypothetical protein
MYQWMVNKRQRSVEEARRMAGDMRAWLVIAAILCDSQADNRLPDRLRCARSSVAVPSASDKRLAVRSELKIGSNAFLNPRYRI